jgi:RNA polymerase sigma-70 factor (ECF subfamily)
LGRRPYAWHQDTPEALLTEDELRKCLEHTISLSELQSSVLVLRERQGLELEEICNLLDALALQCPCAVASCAA